VSFPIIGKLKMTIFLQSLNKESINSVIINDNCIGKILQSRNMYILEYELIEQFRSNIIFFFYEDELLKE
jgi:hypothetical protein